MNNNIKLFSPGPTPIAEDALQALSAPPIHHRSQAFSEVIKRSLKLLKPLFDEEHLVLFSSTGSGALEASVVNFLKKTDVALCLDGGKFGERWSEILSAYDIKHVVQKFPWGETPDPKETEKLLKKHRPQAIYMQACETSTGTAYDIKKTSELIKAHSPKSLLVVDGVTAVGSYPLSMRDNSIDVLLAGSQKALGLPTGLSFLGFSQKAFDAAKTSDLPKYYFNVLQELNSLKKASTFFSSPTQLWLALLTELEKLHKNGLNKKYNESSCLQSLISNWVNENRRNFSISLFSTRPSPSLTAILLPSNISASKVQESLLQKGYSIAKGQGIYSDKLLRIGHMANITQEEMVSFLEILKQSLEEHLH